MIPPHSLSGYKEVKKIITDSQIPEKTATDNSASGAWRWKS